MSHAISDEVRYRLLKYLDENPQATQRQLAAALGVSLGKANYCLKAFMQKGLVKVANFRNSDNKAAYAYYLTPSGMQEKIDVTRAFLRRKMDEYDMLRQEIERLTDEVRRIPAEGETGA